LAKDRRVKELGLRAEVEQLIHKLRQKRRFRSEHAACHSSEWKMIIALVVISALIHRPGHVAKPVNC